MLGGAADDDHDEFIAVVPRVGSLQMASSLATDGSSVVGRPGSRGRVPLRTACSAVGLLLMGIALLIASVSFFVHGHPGWLAFMVLGKLQALSNGLVILLG
jgi:hypothetical protein